MTLTTWVLRAAIVLLLLYEGWTLVNRVPGDTISEAIWAVATKRPLVPFLAGLLCGHLFWQAAR